MKKSAIVIALALGVSPAFAADTLTMTLVSDSPTWTGTATKSWTFTQSEMTLFLAWLQSAYPCSPAGTCTYNFPTGLLAWASGFKNGTVANVTNYQFNQADITARNSVSPINPQ